MPVWNQPFLNRPFPNQSIPNRPKAKPMPAAKPETTKAKPTLNAAPEASCAESLLLANACETARSLCAEYGEIFFTLFFFTLR